MSNSNFYYIFVTGADLLFATNLKRGQDYHGAMNSETFQKWVQEQLIVGLKDYGPCMIVMDNAPYHNKLACQQPTSKWKKDQLIVMRNCILLCLLNAISMFLHELHFISCFRPGCKIIKLQCHLMQQGLSCKRLAKNIRVP